MIQSRHHSTRPASSTTRPQQHHHTTPHRMAWRGRRSRWKYLDGGCTSKCVCDGSGFQIPDFPGNAEFARELEGCASRTHQIDHHLPKFRRAQRSQLWLPYISCNTTPAHPFPVVVDTACHVGSLVAPATLRVDGAVFIPVAFRLFVALLV